MTDDCSDISVAVGLDKSEELVTFLERFFDEINRDAAQAYEYAEARKDGKLIGVAATKEDDENDYIKLAFLHVDEEHRRDGVASQLVEEICRRTEKEEMLAKAHVGWGKANTFYRRTDWQRDRERSAGMLTTYVRDCE